MSTPQDNMMALGILMVVGTIFVAVVGIVLMAAVDHICVEIKRARLRRRRGQ